MSKTNVEQFRERVMLDADLREALRDAADAYEGDQLDDRAVFEMVLVPVAKSAGLDLDYDEALFAAQEGKELTDEELDFVAGGAGSIYHMLMSLRV